MIVVGFALLNPQTNTLLSGLAQAVMYLAILSPAWWVPRLEVDESIMRRTIILLWLFMPSALLSAFCKSISPAIFSPRSRPWCRPWGHLKMA